MNNKIQQPLIGDTIICETDNVKLIGLYARLDESSIPSENRISNTPLIFHKSKATAIMLSAEYKSVR